MSQAFVRPGRPESAAAAIAICCGGQLLVLALAASGAAILTGQTFVVAVVVLVALVAVGAYAWRRFAGRSAVSACAPCEKRPAVQSLGEELHVTEMPGTRELVVPGREVRP